MRILLDRGYNSVRLLSRHQLQEDSVAWQVSILPVSFLGCRTRSDSIQFDFDTRNTEFATCRPIFRHVILDH